MFSLDAFHKEYDTDINELVINGRQFQILLPKNLHRFLNTDDVMQAFPLWAKIWPASLVLADYLAEKPVAAEETIREAVEKVAEAVEEAVEIDATDTARALAEESGIDLSTLTGTGKDGRILKSDVQKAIKAREGN